MRPTIMNYHEYIGSREWRDSVRFAERESAGFRCRIGKSGGEGVTIEAHHRTVRPSSKTSRP
jgi:hypothetical protein